MLKRKAVQTPSDDEKMRRQINDQIQRAEEGWISQRNEL
jgi:hypothetical protein